MKVVFLNILVLLLVLSTSCTKDKAILPETSEPKPPSDFIQMKFIFVNEGDTSLKAVNLESSFYRIHLNTSWIRYKNYPNILPHDSIVHYSDSSKVGAQKKFDVQLFFFQQGVIVKKLFYVSTLSADTLKTPTDGIEIFRWPQDTTRYIKTYQWP